MGGSRAFVVVYRGGKRIGEPDPDNIICGPTCAHTERYAAPRCGARTCVRTRAAIDLSRTVRISCWNTNQDGEYCAERMNRSAAMFIIQRYLRRLPSERENARTFYLPDVPTTERRGSAFSKFVFSCFYMF